MAKRDAVKIWACMVCVCRYIPFSSNCVGGLAAQPTPFRIQFSDHRSSFEAIPDLGRVLKEGLEIGGTTQLIEYSLLCCRTVPVSG